MSRKSVGRDELSSLLRSVWNDEEAGAYYTALRGCDVKTVRALRKCIATPLAVLDTDPATARYCYRGAPCLLNVLLSSTGVGSMSSDLMERIMKSTGGLETEPESMFPCKLLCQARKEWLLEVQCESARSAKIDADSLTAALQKCGIKSSIEIRRMACVKPNNSSHKGVGEPPSNRLAAEALDAVGLCGAASAVLSHLSRLEVCMAGPLLFTAPHGIFLCRDDSPVHKPEDFTTLLARSFAEAVGGSCVTWSEGERSKSEFLRVPDAGNRDPNYLQREDLPTSPWNIALTCHALDHGVEAADQRMGCLHIDVHGRRDAALGVAVDDSDCDVGTGALEYYEGVSLDSRGPTVPRGTAKMIAESLAVELRGCLKDWRPSSEMSEDFVVNTDPSLTGMNERDRFTMSRQGVELGMVSVQLELSRRLRKALKEDAAYQKRFALAILNSWLRCCRMAYNPCTGWKLTR